MDGIADFIRECVAAALHETVMATVVNDGPAARFCAHDPVNKIVHAMYVPRGESVSVNRSWRLVIEPIDSVYLRDLDRVRTEWVTT